jgi:hypothetical protein
MELPPITEMTAFAGSLCRKKKPVNISAEVTAAPDPFRVRGMERLPSKGPHA